MYTKIILIIQKNREYVYYSHFLANYFGLSVK